MQTSFNILTTLNLINMKDLLFFLTILGVIACSISGVLRAIKAKMDITGAILLAFITANGGGTVRDIIIGAEPFWVSTSLYIWLTFGLAVLTYGIFYYNRTVISNKLLFNALLITDACGLAAFSLTGVQKTLLYNHSPLIAIIMGVWTAVGGGIIADIISNKVPLVFSEELYMTISLIGSLTYLVLSGNLNEIFASFIAALIMIATRLLSVKYHLKFPTIS